MGVKVIALPVVCRVVQQLHVSQHLVIEVHRHRAAQWWRQVLQHALLVDKGLHVGDEVIVQASAASNHGVHITGTKPFVDLRGGGGGGEVTVQQGC